MQLFAAPHRTMFFAGMLAAASSGTWWAAEMLGRALPAPLPLQVQVAPVWAHGWLMTWALFGPFIFGFLFTTFPRWQEGREPRKPAYGAVFLLAVASLALAFAGLWGDATLFFAAVALSSLAWIVAWGVLLAVMLGAARIVDHAVVAAIGVGVAAMAQLAFAIAFYTGNAGLLHACLRAALWGGLLPLVYAVCHRMVPFFSQSVAPDYQPYRPRWLLVAFTAGCYAHLALAIAGGYGWLWLPDAALALLAGWSAWRWQGWKTRRVPLAWTLHLAFAWLPLGLALQVIADLGFRSSGDWLLGRAPLHALAIGFLSSLVVAMATRVTLGHSGRRLAMDRLTLACFLAVQAAAVLRVGSELALPVAPQWFAPLVAAAALAWLAGLLPWAWRHGRIYLEPRVDGRSG